MKRLIGLAMMLTALASSAQGKLDLQTALLVDRTQKSEGKISAQSITDTKPVGLLVVVKDGTPASALEAAGATVNSMMGKVASISIKPSDITRLSKVEGVEFISCGSKQPTLYEARIKSNANPAIDGTDGFSHSFTGRGVITGLMDVGIDPTHINFMNSDMTESRVKAVYDFESSDGEYEAYETPKAIKAFATDNESETHGTHTAGIMAGSYRGNATYGLNGKVGEGPNPFYGLASESDIVMCSGMLFDANICAAVGKIIEYAENAGKPAVINLSLGSALGPHDGTDPTSLYLAEAGKHAIICLAAGNDGQLEEAIVKDFTENDTIMQTFLSSRTTGTFTLQVWNSTSEPFESFEFIIYDKTKNEVVASYPLTVSDEVVEFGPDTPELKDAFEEGYASDARGEMIGQVYPSNNRYYVEMNLCTKRKNPPSYNLIAGIRVVGKPGTRVDANSWAAYFYNTGRQGYENGGGFGSISAMCTGDNVIAVGAYTSSSTITRISGDIENDTSVTLDSIYAPTSYGYGKDNRLLPDFCAPGANINSSLNHFYTENNESKATAKATVDGTNYCWGSMQGTSMATPYVAGTCALLLEADPTLGVDEIRDAIARTCDKPEGDMTFNQAVQWGAGKVNTAAAIKHVLQTTGKGAITNDFEKSLVITRSGGSIEVFAAGSDMTKASLVDLQGRSVAAAANSGDTVVIDGSSLSHGVYLLQITTPNARSVKKIAF